MSSVNIVVDDRGVATITVDHPPINLITMEVFFELGAAIQELADMRVPVAGGSAVVVASREVAARCRHRPVWVTGFGEHLTIKTPTYAKDMMQTPVGPASRPVG